MLRAGFTGDVRVVGWSWCWVEDGASAGGAFDGSAHAEFSLELAECETHGPCLASFVKGTGYVGFQRWLFPISTSSKSRDLDLAKFCRKL